VAYETAQLGHKRYTHAPLIANKWGLCLLVELSARWVELLSMTKIYTI